MNTESDRRTVTIPSELWVKVRIEKIQKGHESLSEVVVKALMKYFPDSIPITTLANLPVAHKDYAGMQWITEDSEDAKSIQWSCMRNAAGDYEWVQVAITT